MVGQVPKRKTTILVDGNKVLPPAAVFANSTMLHSRIQEDDYHAGMAHLGVVTIPAALAASEMVNCSGKDLIVALAAGYEVVRCGSGTAEDRIPVSRGGRHTPCAVAGGRHTECACYYPGGYCLAAP